jgi:UDP-4-amino-4,6-dideoxy-N-acetyl-beta-L-altrosamine transaminase
LSPDPTDLAILGGRPVREKLLPYGRQSVDEDDVEAVAAALRSDWLTTGPRVAEFEEAFARFTGAREAVAVSSGTAALHAAAHVLGIGPGDEVLVPAMTFAASANCVRFVGATPVFVDVDPRTLLIDPDCAAARIGPRTRAIIAVDYAGQPCEYDRLTELARKHDLALVADACHSLGASYRGTPVGRLARLSAFSLHPVKTMTTGEGGMVTTDDPPLAMRLRRFRNHGISLDHRQREKAASFSVEMVELGFNYRLTDIQCALGRSQLRKVPGWIERRRQIALRYREALADSRIARPLGERGDGDPAHHLFVVRLDLAALKVDRAQVFAALRAEGIGVNVHYIPVHLHPYYRERLGTGPGLCPVAEAAYAEILSLPLFPAMTDRDADDVMAALAKVERAHGI